MEAGKERRERFCSRLFFCGCFAKFHRDIFNQKNGAVNGVFTIPISYKQSA